MNKLISGGVSLWKLKRQPPLLRHSRILQVDQSKTKVTTRWGGILPEPQKTPFGFLGIIVTVVTGLLVGAAISKNIANFLEENDLFVPSDDDDDDDWILSSITNCFRLLTSEYAFEFKGMNRSWFVLLERRLLTAVIRIYFFYACYFRNRFVAINGLLHC